MNDLPDQQGLRIPLHRLMIQADRRVVVPMGAVLLLQEAVLLLEEEDHPEADANY